MAIEAPLSRYKRNTLKIIIAGLIAFAIYCVYDGYYNEKFQKKHTDENGVADSTLAFNQKAPPYLVGAAVVAGVYLFVIRNRKVTADEKNLIVDGSSIAYEAIEQIDKTNFESKGYFILTYKNPQGGEQRWKLSDRTYDNLESILDEIVAKIS